MAERKVIKAKKQAIRRARLKRAGTVAAMLPLVMSNGAPVAMLIRGRHNEATPGIEQLAEVSEQEIADVILPEISVEEEVSIQEVSEVAPPFTLPQNFIAPTFSETDLTRYEEVNEAEQGAYLGIAPVAGDWSVKDTWPWMQILNVRWLTHNRVEIRFDTMRFDNANPPAEMDRLGGGQIKDMELKVGVGNDFLDEVRFISGEGNNTYVIVLEGITEDVFGGITVYARDMHTQHDRSFRLQGGFLPPNPHVPIVLTEEHIRQGSVAYKFVDDDVSVLESGVRHWPVLELSMLGFTGTFNFNRKIQDIQFASTEHAGLSQINYGTVNWVEIASEIEQELNRQGALLVGQYYEVDVSALQVSFVSTGLFQQGEVRENIPVALQDIKINRGEVASRPFDGTRSVGHIVEHLSLDFEIKMANGDIHEVIGLKVKLPVESLLYDRAGLWASFVHLDGHERQHEKVHAAVIQAVESLSLSYELGEALVQLLTDRIVAQSAVNIPTSRENGLYRGQITLADEGFTPTLLSQLQTVSSKEFDNTNIVRAQNNQEQYTFEFAIMGDNSIDGGKLRFATAVLSVNCEALSFANSYVGTHQIEVDTDVYQNLVFTTRQGDAFDAEDLQAFKVQYGTQITEKIQTLAENGGLFNDAQITPRPVRWTAGLVDNKIYDGTTDVSGIVRPRLEGFIDGDTQIIEVELGDLNEHLRFANSLPGTWLIEGLDFEEESMIIRHDLNIAGNFNYAIVGEPSFNPATISPLVLDINDIDLLNFEKGKITRQYDGTKTYTGSLSPISVIIDGLDDENAYQFVFSSEAELYFDERHVTGDYIPVRLGNTTIGLRRVGGTVQPVELSADLQDKLVALLFLGQITPREVFWEMGTVEDKDYDGNTSAIIRNMPQLFSTPASEGDFGIHDLDKVGVEALIINNGSAAFQSENVAHNTQGSVTAQAVIATDGWTISGGAYIRNYVIVPHPDAESIGFELPQTLFGQSAFDMPDFFYTELVKPRFADATIHPLDVHFVGGALQNDSRTYTGMRIVPERQEFDLPVLSTILGAKQDLLNSEKSSGRVRAVEGDFVHNNNLDVGTAVSALSGWSIEGYYHTNYRLVNSPDIEWEITAKKIELWEDVAGAQSGFATKRFDDTVSFSEAQVFTLPRLFTDDLDITNWQLRYKSPDVLGVTSLIVENFDWVGEQLNTLLGPNQVLADNFDFTSLFKAQIEPRILSWETGTIPSRPYNGTTSINTDNIVLPHLVPKGPEHEILDNHVTLAYNSSLLENLTFDDVLPGTYEFNWHEAVGLEVLFDESRHQDNYIVLQLDNARASIFPTAFNKADLDENFSASDREYDGQVDIMDNLFMAHIHLEDGLILSLPYHVEGLRFANPNAGTYQLEFDSITLDVKSELFYPEDIADIHEQIETAILEYRDAQIIPRHIEWTEGRVANKEWDDTYDIYQILVLPDLRRPDNDFEKAIVARDQERFTITQGGASFTQKDVGINIPVVSDGNWSWSTTDGSIHPLSNYIFEGYQAGILPQPRFEAASITQVSVIDVKPMPENPNDMKANILYIQSGYIERQYNGTSQIDLVEDVKSQPEFSLRNAQDQVIMLSLEQLEELTVNFLDKDVAYDNNNVADKEVITNISGLTHTGIELSDNHIREIERLLFTGRITPWELNKEDVHNLEITFEGNRVIHHVYNGKTDWLVPEGLDNDGETIKIFPELWIELVTTGENIPILFSENYVISFADRHAGTDKHVNIDGFYLDSQNVSLHGELKEWMRSELITGHISPLTIRWTKGQVARRHYDGTKEAVIDVPPTLPIFAIDLPEINNPDAGVNIQTGQAHFDTADVRYDEAGNVIAMPVHASGTDDWGISGRYSGNYWLQPTLLSTLDSLLPLNEVLSSFVPRPVQRVNPLFESQIIDPIRLGFNGRKIAERVFNYDSYFTPAEKSYEYGSEAGFTDSEKWINMDTGQPMDVIGDYYLTISFVEQLSRLANGQPHVSEDELVFVDSQGNVIDRADVFVELRDEQGNLNRNYEYVFGDDVETIGRITKAEGFPVTKPQAAHVGETEIELFNSHIMMHRNFLENMPIIFEPFTLKEADTALRESESLLAEAATFDPGPYLIEYAVSRSERPEDLSDDAWQTSTLFTGLLPSTEYFLFARQADHHNRYEGEIIVGTSVVTLEETPREPENGGTGEEGERPDTNGSGETNDQGNNDASEDNYIQPEEEIRDEEDRTESSEAQGTRAELPSTGTMLGLGLGITGLVALASAAILRKKNKKD
jgi:hypothetical protein